LPLLADGKNVLEVVFVAASGDSKVADMTATGARLLSLEPAPDDPQTWVVQLRPERGVSQACLTVPLQTYAIVFPLTVAPRLKIDLDKSGDVTPADFALFLKKRSAFDLNGDGKRDYRDDYLFTANYLVALRGEKKSGGQPPKAQ
jgi:membrane-bound lytic murein transglycosylase B